MHRDEADAPPAHPARWRLGPSEPPGEHALRVARYWRWPLVVALLLTIPAFYIELLDATPPLGSMLGYLGAAGAVAAALAHTSWRSTPRGAHLRVNLVDVALVAGLLASAVAPPSAQSQPALLLRLLVAFVILLRLVWEMRQHLRRGSLVHLLLTALGVLGLCGVGYWWLEPRTPTLADGLWLAFTTAATVGYGDLVPTTAASRIFSVFVVLLGYGVLSVVTAAIAATWVENEERRIEREILSDLHRELRRLRAEVEALRRGDAGADAGARTDVEP